jgi:hypothetical protein
MDALIKFAHDKITENKGQEYTPDVMELQKFIETHLLNQFSFYDMKMCFLAGWRAGLKQDISEEKIKYMNEYIEFILNEKLKNK